jgi:hypothetical protein
VAMRKISEIETAAAVAATLAASQLKYDRTSKLSFENESTD